MFLVAYSLRSLKWFHKQRKVHVFFHSATVPSWPGTLHFRGFITLRRTALSNTPVDEWSAQRRDLYLTTHNTHKRQIFSPPGFETATPAIKWPQTHVLDRAARVIEVYTIRKKGSGKCGVELSSRFTSNVKSPITGAADFVKTSPPSLCFTPYYNT